MLREDRSKLNKIMYGFVWVRVCGSRVLPVQQGGQCFLRRKNVAYSSGAYAGPGTRQVAPGSGGPTLYRGPWIHSIIQHKGGRGIPRWHFVKGVRMCRKSPRPDSSAQHSKRLHAHTYTIGDSVISSDLRTRFWPLGRRHSKTPHTEPGVDAPKVPIYSCTLTMLSRDFKYQALQKPYVI